MVTLNEWLPETRRMIRQDPNSSNYLSHLRSLEYPQQLGVGLHRSPGVELDWSQLEQFVWHV